MDKLYKTLQELPLSDKWLLGVSIVILVNYKLAILLALASMVYFIYKFYKEFEKVDTYKN